MVLLAALLLALLIDRLWGEPPAAIHPVVAMGFYLKLAGRRLPGLPAAAAFGAGMLAWCVGMLATGVLAGWLQALVLTQLPEFLSVLVLAVLLKPMLSWRMLRDEVGAVEAALQQSLEAGRERLSWLVSRDTASLSESEVRESAIESLAENLNDSVVAPIFWFVLFGLPGAAIYRFANTADAMWGYRGVYHGKNWEWAGKWAARADDVLSWLPARLTALLLALVAGGLAWKTLRAEAGKTPSPNSGWPMAAMALALGVRLRKPGAYTLNAAGRAPEATDTHLALDVASKVVLALAALAPAAILLIASGVAR
jgi:adenosylcobinamide-phosphate synthase